MARQNRHLKCKEDIMELIGDVADSELDYKIELIKDSNLYKNIYNSLLDKIEKDKALVDLVYDYMELYVTKSLLICDIERNGVTIETVNYKGDTVRKKNESITELTKVNTQMLKILQHLDIKNNKSDDNDEWTL